MKTSIFNYLAVIATALLLMPTASATWGTSFRSLGKDATFGEPECVAIADKQVVCVAQSQQGTLMANEFSNNTWSGWTSLAGVGNTNPSCVNDGEGKVLCGAWSAAHTLTATVFDGTNWSDFVDSDGVITTESSCALLRKGKVFCTARNLAGALTGAAFDTTALTWGKFQTAAGATITSAPSCAGDADRDVICSVDALVNNLNSFVVNRFNGSKWEGFLNLDNNSPSFPKPSCTSLGLKGQVTCFERTGGVFYANRFESGQWSTGNWSGWRAITSGGKGPRISCALLSASSGSLACGTSSVQDLFMYAGTYDGTNWSSFTKIGNKTIWAGPGCAALGAGKAICTVIETNNQAGSVTGP